MNPLRPTRVNGKPPLLLRSCSADHDQVRWTSTELCCWMCDLPGVDVGRVAVAPYRNERYDGPSWAESGTG